MLDDLLELRTGDQVPADGVVHRPTGWRSTSRCSPASRTRSLKAAGRRGAVGRIVVAGSGRFQATAVGADAYARKLAAEARRFTLAHSELVDGINRILHVRHLGARRRRRRCCSCSQFQAREPLGGDHRRGRRASSRMVPEGLVLLTSIAFGLAAVDAGPPPGAGAGAAGGRGAGPGRRGVPRQDGHAHRGHRRVRAVELLDPRADDAIVAAALGALSHDEGGNATLDAIAAAFPAPDGWVRDGLGPVLVGPQVERGVLRRARRWVLGAPEMVVLDGATTRPGRRPTSSPPPAAGCCSWPAPTRSPARSSRPACSRSRSCCSRRRCAPTPPTRSRTSPSRACS